MLPLCSGGMKYDGGVEYDRKGEKGGLKREGKGGASEGEFKGRGV